MTTLIALDTETTGIGPRYHRLLEIAALEFDAETGLPTGNHFHTYLNPKRSVPEESVAVHGMTEEMLKDAPLFKEKAPELLEFIAGREVIIHNAPFDVGFLNNELKKAKLAPLNEVVAAVVDTCSLSRRYVPAKLHNLDTLCDRYQVDRSKRTLHGALIDCEILAAVYPGLMKDVNAARDKIMQVLPFGLDAPLSDEVDELAERYLRLEALIKVLTGDQDRYKEAIREMVQGSDVDGEFFTVEFKNRVTTDWAAIQEKFLQGVDLKPFQSQGSAMSLKGK